MNNKIILDFLKLPPSIKEFPTYESRIHSEISAQISDVKTLILTIMAELSLDERKNMLKLKKSLDSIKTQFDVIQSSIFSTKDALSISKF